MHALYDSIGVGYDATRRADLQPVALLDDMNSGYCDEVAAAYGAGMGDYMFVVAEKTAPVQVAGQKGMFHATDH